MVYQNKTKCKGVWVRVERYVFPQNKSHSIYELRIRLIPLKKRTCLECPECQSILADMHSGLLGSISHVRTDRWYNITRNGDRLAITEYPRKYKEEQDAQM